MYPIRPIKTDFAICHEKKIDKRRHVKCQANDPDAFRIMRIVDFDDGGY